MRSAHGTQFPNIVTDSRHVWRQRGYAKEIEKIACASAFCVVRREFSPVLETALHTGACLRLMIVISLVAASLGQGKMVKTFAPTGSVGLVRASSSKVADALKPVSRASPLHAHACLSFALVVEQPSFRARAQNWFFSCLSPSPILLLFRRRTLPERIGRRR